MPKLVLKFDDRVIKEYAVEAEVTIGRLPDNTVVIDNPAVSSHHARLFREGDQLVVEDLRSKNGTYLNDEHVVRAALKSGDVLQIGKHRIEYAETNDVVVGTAVAAPPPTIGPTAYLDTRQHRAMLAKLREARAARERAAAANDKSSDTSVNADRIGVLRVLGGGVDGSEYTLHAQSSIIGKSESAVVRLRGWFKPRVAAAIVKDGPAYYLTPSTGRTLVNGEHLHSKRQLRDGDVLDIAGVVFEFRVNGVAGEADPRPNVA